MKYTPFWTDQAIKDLGKLPKPTALRIFNKVESITDDPHRTAERCEGYPWYHQRVGAYRAILEIDDANLLISILKVGARKKVYDR
jgi:mRNA interferase RelE/StbE